MRNCSTSHGRTNDTEWVSNLIRTADDPGENDRRITHQLRERERERDKLLVRLSMRRSRRKATTNHQTLLSLSWIQQHTYVYPCFYLHPFTRWGKLMKANQTQSSNPKEMNLPKKNKNDNNHIARIFLMPFGCDCRDKRSSVWVCVCVCYFGSNYFVCFFFFFFVSSSTVMLLCQKVISCRYRFCHIVVAVVVLLFPVKEFC